MRLVLAGVTSLLNLEHLSGFYAKHHAPDSHTLASVVLLEKSQSLSLKVFWVRVRMKLPARTEKAELPQLVGRKSILYQKPLKRDPWADGKADEFPNFKYVRSRKKKTKQNKTKQNKAKQCQHNQKENKKNALQILRSGGLS